MLDGRPINDDEAKSTPSRIGAALWEGFQVLALSSMDAINGYTLVTSHLPNPFSWPVIAYSSASAAVSFYVSAYYQYHYGPHTFNQTTLQNGEKELIGNLLSLQEAIKKNNALMNAIDKTLQDRSHIELEAKEHKLHRTEIQPYHIKKMRPYNRACNWLQVVTETSTGAGAGLCINNLFKIAGPFRLIAPVALGVVNGVVCKLFHSAKFNFASRVSVSMTMYENNELKTHMTELCEKAGRLKTSTAQLAGRLQIKLDTSDVTIPMPTDLHESKECETDSLVSQTTNNSNPSRRQRCASVTLQILGILSCLAKGAMVMLGIQSIKQTKDTLPFEYFIVGYALLLAFITAARAREFKSFNHTMSRYNQFAERLKYDIADEEEKLNKAIANTEKLETALKSQINPPLNPQ